MNLMSLTGVGGASLAALAWSAPAMADSSIDGRLATMEQRVAAQDQVIVERESEIAALSTMEDAWFSKVEIGGVIELELVSESPPVGGGSTEAGVGTAELAISAAINDEFSGEIVVEQDGETIALDGATLTYELEGHPFFATGGLQSLPFGVYDTNLISDPLTNELGDTDEVSLVLGVE